MPGNHKIKIKQVVVFTGWLLLSACSTGAKQGHNDLAYLAKSDIDNVADIHRRQSQVLVEELVGKLYRRNPSFCTQHNQRLESCIDRALHSSPAAWEPLIGECQGSTCIERALSEEFNGDRVLALSVGLRTMLDAAYQDKQEFFLTDELDPQKLYNSARNIEIMVWRLSNRLDNQNRPYLLTDSLDEGVRNLSYERLFGKLISLQDTLAAILAERDNRRIKNVIQRLATAVFLPI